jgi:hypothetical protein
VYVGTGSVFIEDTVTHLDAELTVTDGVLYVNGVAAIQIGDITLTDTGIEFADGTVQTTAATPGNVNGAGATQSVSQTFPNGPYTPVTYDTGVFSQSSPGLAPLWAVGANTRMTAPVAGLYVVTASLMVNPPGAAEFCGFFLRVNENDATDCAFTGLVANTSDIFALSTSAVLQLNAGDYVEACVYNDTGGNVTSFTSNRCSQFSAALLT